MTPRARKFLASCFSAGLHLFVVVPFGIARLLIDTTPQLTVTFVQSDEEGAADAPPVEQDERKPLLAQAEENEPKPEKDDEPPDPAKRQEKAKEEELEKPTPPPLWVLPDAHLKMVDQDQFPDEEDNAKANYLAQKNHHAREETRAEDTNLLRRQQGARASEESERQDGETGDKERKAAELEDHAGDPRRLPTSLSSAPGDRARDQREQPLHRPSPLALRDLVPAERPTETSREGLERAEPGEGPLPLRRQGQPQAAQRAPGARANLRLSHDDYERIVGFDVAARERAEALAQRSRTPGRWARLQQKLAMMRASLENFTPSVRPGSESELGTRRHPFAAYLATMHRQIHKFWGFGYLAELDGKPASSPYNDMSLWTGLEIALKPDGTVDKIVIERPSGNGPFDAAAMDAVLSGGPYPPPPDVIKSRDGKVYISWRFHRDNRQCATDFVQPHILTTPPRDGAPAQEPPAPAPPREGLSRSLLSLGSPGGGEQRGTARSASAGRTAAPDPAGPEGPGAPPSEGGAPGRAPRASAEFPAEARTVAEQWLQAYVRGDARWLAGHSAVPFSAGGRTVADDGETLRAMYRQLVQERSDRSGTLSYYTRAEVKKRLGRLPAGGEEEDMVFALLRSGSDDIVLLLQPADQGWRVVGIDR